MTDPHDPGTAREPSSGAGRWIGQGSLPAPPDPPPTAVRRRGHLRLVGTAATPATPATPAEATVPAASDRLPAADPVPGPEPAPKPVPIAVVPGPPPLPVPAPPDLPPLAPPVLPATARHRRLNLRDEAVALLVVIAVGAAAAVGVDSLVGRVDGLPPAYLLVFLALPVWDLLPRPLAARVAVVTVDAAVAAAVWWGLAAVPVRLSAWHDDLAFALACLVTGALHLGALALLRARYR